MAMCHFIFKLVNTIYKNAFIAFDFFKDFLKRLIEIYDLIFRLGKKSFLFFIISIVVNVLPLPLPTTSKIFENASIRKDNGPNASIVDFYFLIDLRCRKITGWSKISV